MHLIEIPEANIKINMPAELAECNAREYMEMCELMFRYQFAGLSYDELRTQAVYKLLNLKPSQADVDDDAELEKWANIYRLSELIDDFFDVDLVSEQIKIKQNYIHNPVPSFKPMMVEYFGPSDSFMNMKYGEYTDALREFLDFAANGSIESLYIIAAILYRPAKSNYKQLQKQPDFDGDIREKYNSNTLKARADRFQKEMPMGFVYGAYLLFASFQQFVCTAKIPWGGKEIDLSILFDTGGSNEEPTDEDTPGLGMDSLTFTIAESGAFGPIEALRNTGLWEILIRMYDLRKRDLDEQKRQKENDRRSQP